MKNWYSHTVLIEKENLQVDLLLSGSSTIKQFVINTRGQCTKIEHKHVELFSVLEEGDLREYIDILEELDDQTHLLQMRN